MAGVYISYPFCNQKCTFCNFASDVSSPETRAAYGVSLLTQLRAHSWHWNPETLYFGGGTPSLMPLALLPQLIAGIPTADLRESTMEAAPGTLTPENIEAWRNLGINRVSLGVQSFVEAELRQTGRRHSSAIVASDVAMLRAGGIENFNIDLIAGLPGQTLASWTESLRSVERLNTPHVSVYVFEVDEESRLGSEMLLGGVRYGAAAMPSDDLIAELYETAVSRLKSFGVERYEISNFARPDFQSLHNLKYWKLEPYIGFGLDAHSHLNGQRFGTSDNMADYLAQPTKRHNFSVTDPGEEHFFVGLRLDSGIQPDADEWVRFAAPIEKWTHAGMLVRVGKNLRLSAEGALLSNEIFADFLNLEPVHA